MLNVEYESCSEDSPPPSDNLPEITYNEINDLINCFALCTLDHNNIYLINPETLYFRELIGYLFCELSKISALKDYQPAKKFYDELITSSLDFIQEKNIAIYLKVSDKKLQSLESDFFYLLESVNDLITYLQKIPDFTLKINILNYLLQLSELTHAVSQKFALDNYKKNFPAKLNHINQFPVGTSLARQSIFHKIIDIMKPSAKECMQSKKLKI